MQLVLSIGSSSCTLSSNELENYPDSLLTNIITTAAGSSGSNGGSSSGPLNAVAAFSDGHLPAAYYTDGAVSISKPKLLSKSSTITINLDYSRLPLNTLHVWPEALQLIPSMYRSGYISADLLEQHLNKWQRAAGTTASTTTRCALDLHQKLADLLAFLNLPGPVSRWLPISTMELYHANCFEFAYQCIAFEAVDMIMRYKPMAYLSASSGLHPSRVATFLITTTTPAGSSSPYSLQVQAVETSITASIAAQLAATGAQAGCWSGKECQLHSDYNGTALRVGISPAITLPQRSAVSGIKSVLDMSVETLRRNAVGVSHPALGVPLANAMAAALQGTPYMAGHCNVEVRPPNGYMTHLTVKVPLWVVKW